MPTPARDPAWVQVILDWPGTWPLARLALTSAYWVGGLSKLLDWQGAVSEVAGLGLQPPTLIAALTVFVEIAGAGLVISGRAVWLGAGGLGVFTLLASLRVNNFWALEGHARFTATNSFFEHLGLIGGLVLAALVSQHLRREHPARIARRAW